MFRQNDCSSFQSELHVRLSIGSKLFVALQGYHYDPIDDKNKKSKFIDIIVGRLVYPSK